MQEIRVEIKHTKECKLCKLFKSLDEFDKQSGAKDKRKPWCKLCCKDKNRKRYLDNPKKFIENATDYYKTKHGKNEIIQKSELGNLLEINSKIN